MNDTITLIKAAKQSLEMHAAEDGGFLPTVVTEYFDGQRHVALLAAEGHPYDVLRSNAVGIVHGPLASISLTCDTYMYVGAKEGASYGNLGVRFNNGDPDVTEALSITVAEALNDRVTGIHLPYVRKGATIEWGEPMESDVVDGRMVDLLQAIIDASCTYEEGD